MRALILGRAEPRIERIAQRGLRVDRGRQVARLDLALRARVVGEYILPDVTDEAATSFVEYRNVAELGGFVVSGPIAGSEVTGRFGAGEYRVSAYALDAPGMRWEVYATLDEDSHISQGA